MGITTVVGKSMVMGINMVFGIIVVMGITTVVGYHYVDGDKLNHFEILFNIFIFLHNIITTRLNKINNRTLINNNK